MQLSIIIVNFNVKLFLEQCLCSVTKAIEHLEAEVFVVDNNSSDGSVAYLKPRFPWVKFILNQGNQGFSKANNQALSEASSKYILFLNPDTIVAEDSFQKCIDFMDAHPEAGALAVHMVNGSGIYLKESKRGFPSPWVSFCKLSGLTAVFPNSKLFAGYYLGHLDEKQNQVIDSISGAFLFSRRDILVKEKGFDERFFMYAEDIDLSYRIQKAGFVNYYLAETTIIHFKGECTKKDLKYVRLFYKAMSLFVQKQFGGSKNSFSSLMIEPAIWLRASITAIKSIFKQKAKKVQEQKRKLSFVGDIDEIENIKPLLNPSLFEFSEIGEAEIVFCQGKSFAFKDLIDRVSKNKKKSVFKFHASGSSSLVGSNEQILIGVPVV